MSCLSASWNYDTCSKMFKGEIEIVNTAVV